MLEMILVGMLGAVVLALVAFAIDDARERGRALDVRAPHRSSAANFDGEPRWQRAVDEEPVQEKKAA